MPADSRNWHKPASRPSGTAESAQLVARKARKNCGKYPIKCATEAKSGLKVQGSNPDRLASTRMVPMLESCSTLHRQVRRFLRQGRGSVVPTFAVALVPMVALVGAAVDYSRANSIRSQMEGALDAAVLAGARDDTASWTQTAQNTFDGLFQPKGATGATPTFVLNGDGSFTGSASATVPMDFLGSFGISAINVRATTTAMLAPTSPESEYCLLALNLTAAQSMKIAGNGEITITAPSCVMQVNSNDSDAVNLSGNAQVSTTDNCFVGGLRTVDHSSLSPPPD